MMYTDKRDDTLRNTMYTGDNLTEIVNSLEQCLFYEKIHQSSIIPSHLLFIIEDILCKQSIDSTLILKERRRIEVLILIYMIKPEYSITEGSLYIMSQIMIQLYKKTDRYEIHKILGDFLNIILGITPPLLSIPINKTISASIYQQCHKPLGDTKKLNNKKKIGINVDTLLFRKLIIFQMICNILPTFSTVLHHFMPYIIHGTHQLLENMHTIESKRLIIQSLMKCLKSCGINGLEMANDIRQIVFIAIHSKFCSLIAIGFELLTVLIIHYPMILAKYIHSFLHECLLVAGDEDDTIRHTVQCTLATCFEYYVDLVDTPNKNPSSLIEEIDQKQQQKKLAYLSTNSKFHWKKMYRAFKKDNGNSDIRFIFLDLLQCMGGTIDSNPIESLPHTVPLVVVWFIWQISCPYSDYMTSCTTVNIVDYALSPQSMTQTTDNKVHYNELKQRHCHLSWMIGNNQKEYVYGTRSGFFRECLCYSFITFCRRMKLRGQHILSSTLLFILCIPLLSSSVPHEFEDMQSSTTQLLLQTMQHTTQETSYRLTESLLHNHSFQLMRGHIVTLETLHIIRCVLFLGQTVIQTFAINESIILHILETSIISQLIIALNDLTRPNIQEHHTHTIQHTSKPPTFLYCCLRLFNETIPYVSSTDHVLSLKSQLCDYFVKCVTHHTIHLQNPIHIEAALGLTRCIDSTHETLMERCVLLFNLIEVTDNELLSIPFNSLTDNDMLQDVLTRSKGYTMALATLLYHRLEDTQGLSFPNSFIETLFVWIESLMTSSYNLSTTLSPSIVVSRRITGCIVLHGLCNKMTVPLRIFYIERIVSIWKGILGRRALTILRTVSDMETSGTLNQMVQLHSLTSRQGVCMTHVSLNKDYVSSIHAGLNNRVIPTNLTDELTLIWYTLDSIRDFFLPSKTHYMSCHLMTPSLQKIWIILILNILQLIQFLPHPLTILDTPPLSLGNSIQLFTLFMTQHSIQSSSTHTTSTPDIPLLFNNYGDTPWANEICRGQLFILLRGTLYTLLLQLPLSLISSRLINVLHIVADDLTRPIKNPCGFLSTQIQTFLPFTSDLEWIEQTDRHIPQSTHWISHQLSWMCQQLCSKIRTSSTLSTTDVKQTHQSRVNQINKFKYMSPMNNLTYPFIKKSYDQQTSYDHVYSVSKILPVDTQDAIHGHSNDQQSDLPFFFKYPINQQSYVEQHHIVPSWVLSLGHDVDSTSKLFQLDSNEFQSGETYWRTATVKLFSHIMNYSLIESSTKLSMLQYLLNQLSESQNHLLNTPNDPASLRHTLFNRPIKHPPTEPISKRFNLFPSKSNFSLSWGDHLFYSNGVPSTTRHTIDQKFDTSTCYLTDSIFYNQTSCMIINILFGIRYYVLLYLANVIQKHTVLASTLSVSTQKDKLVSSPIPIVSSSSDDIPQTDNVIQIQHLLLYELDTILSIVKEVTTHYGTSIEHFLSAELIGMLGSLALLTSHDVALQDILRCINGWLETVHLPQTKRLAYISLSILFQYAFVHMGHIESHIVYSLQEWFMTQVNNEWTTNCSVLSKRVFRLLPMCLTKYAKQMTYQQYHFQRFNTTLIVKEFKEWSIQTSTQITEDQIVSKNSQPVCHSITEFTQTILSLLLHELTIQQNHVCQLWAIEGLSMMLETIKEKALPIFNDIIDTINTIVLGLPNLSQSYIIAISKLLYIITSHVIIGTSQTPLPHTHQDIPSLTMCLLKIIPLWRFLNGQTRHDIYGIGSSYQDIWDNQILNCVSVTQHDISSKQAIHPTLPTTKSLSEYRLNHYGDFFAVNYSVLSLPDSTLIAADIWLLLTYYYILVTKEWDIIMDTSNLMYFPGIVLLRRLCSDHPLLKYLSGTIINHLLEYHHTNFHELFVLNKSTLDLCHHDKNKVFLFETFLIVLLDNELSFEFQSIIKQLLKQHIVHYASYQPFEILQWLTRYIVLSPSDWYQQSMISLSQMSQSKSTELYQEQMLPMGLEDDQSCESSDTEQHPEMINNHNILKESETHSPNDSRSHNVHGMTTQRIKKSVEGLKRFIITYDERHHVSFNPIQIKRYRFGKSIIQHQKKSSRSSLNTSFKHLQIRQHPTRPATSHSLNYRLLYFQYNYYFRYRTKQIVLYIIRCLCEQLKICMDDKSLLQEDMRCCHSFIPSRDNINSFIVSSIPISFVSFKHLLDIFISMTNLCLETSELQSEGLMFLRTLLHICQDIDQHYTTKTIQDTDFNQPLLTIYERQIVACLHHVISQCLCCRNDTLQHPTSIQIQSLQIVYDAMTIVTQLVFYYQLKPTDRLVMSIWKCVQIVYNNVILSKDHTHPYEPYPYDTEFFCFLISCYQQLSQIWVGDVLSELELSDQEFFFTMTWTLFRDSIITYFVSNSFKTTFQLTMLLCLSGLSNPLYTTQFLTDIILSCLNHLQNLFSHHRQYSEDIPQYFLNQFNSTNINFFWIPNNIQINMKQNDPFFYYIQTNTFTIHSLCAFYLSMVLLHSSFQEIIQYPIDLSIFIPSLLQKETLQKISESHLQQFYHTCHSLQDTFTLCHSIRIAGLCCLELFLSIQHITHPLYLQQSLDSYDMFLYTLNKQLTLIDHTHTIMLLVIENKLQMNECFKKKYYEINYLNFHILQMLGDLFNKWILFQQTHSMSSLLSNHSSMPQIILFLPLYLSVILSSINILYIIVSEDQIHLFTNETTPNVLIIKTNIQVIIESLIQLIFKLLHHLSNNTTKELYRIDPLENDLSSVMNLPNSKHLLHDSESIPINGANTQLIETDDITIIEKDVNIIETTVKTRTNHVITENNGFFIQHTDRASLPLEILQDILFKKYYMLDVTGYTELEFPLNMIILCRGWPHIIQQIIVAWKELCTILSNHLATFNILKQCIKLGLKELSIPPYSTDLIDRSQINLLRVPLFVSAMSQLILQCPKPDTDQLELIIIELFEIINHSIQLYNHGQQQAYRLGEKLLAGISTMISLLGTSHCCLDDIILKHVQDVLTLSLKTTDIIHQTGQEDSLYLLRGHGYKIIYEILRLSSIEEPESSRCASNVTIVVQLCMALQTQISPEDPYVNEKLQELGKMLFTASRMNLDAFRSAVSNQSLFTMNADEVRAAVEMLFRVHSAATMKVKQDNETVTEQSNSDISKIKLKLKF